MLITLIGLVILLISAVALIRSFDTSLVLSGNLAFKRDLMNQGERGMAKAITLLSSGALSTDSSRTADLLTSNYSSSILASDTNGIPLVLVNDSSWTMTAGDISDTTSGVTIRYVIDRQCTAAGAFSTSNCVAMPGTIDTAGTWHLSRRAGSSYRPVYRISVRIIGPRNTQAFLQSTVVL